MKHLLIILILSFTTLINAQNIGLNIDTPDENIHMIGDLRVDNYNSGDIILRLYKDKQAFRTGKLALSYFDLDSIGTGSFAAGEDLTALGLNSAAFGRKNRALGNYSFSSGSNNEIFGTSSFSSGGYNTLYGDYNTSFGYSHHGTGLFNLLGGYNNAVNGTASAVFGASNSSTSDGSFTSGIGLITNSYSSTFLGSYNSEYANTLEDFWDSDDPLFVIGNGTSSSLRNNAFVLMKNGKVGIDVDQPTESLDVNGNIKTSGNFIGDGSQLTNLQADEDWNISGGTMYNTTHNVSIGGISSSSDLYVTGDKGIYFNYQNPPTSYGKGFQIKMISPGKSSAGTSANSGIFVDLNATNATNVGANIFVTGDNTNTNQVGVSAYVKGTADNKIGVSSLTINSANSNIGGSFHAKDATTENIGVKAIAEGSFGSAVGIYAEATGVGNLAGDFVGDVDISDDLEVADLTTTNKLKVGPGTSSYFSAMQGGTYVVGPDNTASDQAPADGIKVISVTFPYSFPTTPRIIVTSSAQTGTTFNDAFSVTTRSVTTTGCVLIIKRLDSDSEWAQYLRVDWFGFSL